MDKNLEDARVESYAGHKGDETPRAVILEGKRFAVLNIISRKRALDRASGKMADIWVCRLDDGRAMTVELLEDGAWRVSAAA